MDIEQVRNYCLSKKAATEDLPFDADTLCLRVMNRIFAILPLDAEPPTLNLKCDPDRAVELRERYPDDIVPGYHMNKKHWNTVRLDGNLDAALIRQLIDHSYDLVVKSLRKSEQHLLSG